MEYYSAIILLSLMSLGILSILVHENGRIHKTDKRTYYLAYLLIALSALAEWIGIRLDGVKDLPSWPLQLAKCADYILTPMAGGALAAHMKLRNRWHSALKWVLAANAVFQLLAVCNGWMVSIDGSNHYSHGPLYIIYVLIYVAVIALVTVEFILYGRTFRRQNRKSLYASLVLVLCGAARSIRRVFDAFGQCYRTGGDEFMVLASMDRVQADAALAGLAMESASWSAQTGEELSLAAGYALAADSPELSPEKLAIEADKAMYADKSRYYRESGRDRRRY